MTSLDLGLVLISALLHAAWNAAAKTTESPTAYLAIMGAATLVLGAPLFFYVDLALIPRVVWWLLAGSGIVHTAYQLFLGRAYEQGDLSVVYPISRSTPALVALIAIPFLDDPVSTSGALGIAVVMLGMWLVHTNGVVSLAALLAPGIAFAYLTLLATVGYSLIDKVAMKTLEAAPWTTPVPKAIVYYYLLSIAYMIPFGPIVLKRVPTSVILRMLRTRALFLLFGLVASFASYVLILEALQTASVSYVTAVRQTSVVFASALSLVLLRERPTRPRLLGSLLTVVGVGLIALAT